MRWPVLSVLCPSGTPTTHISHFDNATQVSEALVLLLFFSSNIFSFGSSNWIISVDLVSSSLHLSLQSADKPIPIELLEIVFSVLEFPLKKKKKIVISIPLLWFLFISLSIAKETTLKSFSANSNHVGYLRAASRPLCRCMVPVLARDVGREFGAPMWGGFHHWSCRQKTYEDAKSTQISLIKASHVAQVKSWESTFHSQAVARMWRQEGRENWDHFYQMGASLPFTWLKNNIQRVEFFM